MRKRGRATRAPGGVRWRGRGRWSPAPPAPKAAEAFCDEGGAAAAGARIGAPMRSPALAYALLLTGLASLGCASVIPCHRFPDHELGEDEYVCACDGIGSCALTCDPALPCEVGCGDVEFAAIDCTGNPFCDASCSGADVVTLDCTDADVCFLICQSGQVCEVDCAGAAECTADCDFGGECTATNCEAGACTVSVNPRVTPGRST